MNSITQLYRIKLPKNVVHEKDNLTGYYWVDRDGLILLYFELPCVFFRLIITFTGNFKKCTLPHDLIGYFNWMQFNADQGFELVYIMGS